MSEEKSVRNGIVKRNIRKYVETQLTVFTFSFNFVRAITDEDFPFEHVLEELDVTPGWISCE